MNTPAADGDRIIRKIVRTGPSSFPGEPPTPLASKILAAEPISAAASRGAPESAPTKPATAGRARTPRPGSADDGKVDQSSSASRPGTGSKRASSRSRGGRRRPSSSPVVGIAIAAAGLLVVVIVVYLASSRRAAPAHRKADDEGKGGSVSAIHGSYQAATLHQLLSSPLPEVRSFAEDAIAHGDSSLGGTPENRARLDGFCRSMTAALDDHGKRAAAADALGLVIDSDLDAMRPALEKLATLVEDPACLHALAAVVGGAYQRGDVLRANGQDAQRWRDFLAADHLRYQRIQEIGAWLEANRKYQRVEDGAARLGESKRWLDAAKADVQGWADDKALPPLGITSARLDKLSSDLKLLGLNVGNSLAGAKN